MSHEPPHRSRSTPMPAVVWLLLGVLLVALFVLALGVLQPVG